MNKNDTLNVAFSVYKMKSDPNYNPKKYDWVVPKAFKKQKEIYSYANAYQLHELTQYGKNNMIVRLIINYYVKNNTKLEKVNNDDYHYFVQMLKEYKNTFSLFLNREDLSNIYPKDIYQMYIKQEIPFYVFYFVFKFVRFKENIINDMLIKRKILQVKPLNRLFTLFDEDYIKEELKTFQSIVSLR